MRTLNRKLHCQQGSNAPSGGNMADFLPRWFPSQDTVIWRINEYLWRHNATYNCTCALTSKLFFKRSITLFQAPRASSDQKRQTAAALPRFTQETRERRSEFMMTDSLIPAATWRSLENSLKSPIVRLQGKTGGRSGKLWDGEGKFQCQLNCIKKNVKKERRSEAKALSCWDNKHTFRKNDVADFQNS